MARLSGNRRSGYIERQPRREFDHATLLTPLTELKPTSS
jgi:hypothetical protein